MNEALYDKRKIFLDLSIVFALTTVLQILLGFGLFAPGTNDYIGYIIGVDGFIIFFLIYVLIKNIE